MYANCLRHCFKSTVEDDFQQTIKALSKNDQAPSQKTLQEDDQIQLEKKIRELEKYAEVIKKRKSFLRT